MPPQFFQPFKLLRQDCVENVDEYKLGGHHPVQIDDTFEDNRYTIIHKLGSGGFSTVWLAFDAQNNSYVALKFVIATHSTQEYDFSKDFDNLFEGSNKGKSDCQELKIIQYIAENFDEESKKRLAVEVETFWVQGVNGKHLVFASPVNGPCLQDYALKVHYSPDFARKITLDAAKALQELHKAGVVHGDFTTRNILLKLHNLDSLCYEEVEACFGRVFKEKLLPKRGHFPDRSAPKWIFKEANMCQIPAKYIKDEVIIIDFGLSFHASSQPPIDGAGSPYSYRPPEMMKSCEARLFLHTADGPSEKLGDKLDIWALACDIFEVRTRNQLFPGCDDNEDTVYSVRDTMAEIWLEDSEDDWTYMSDKAYDKQESLRSKIEEEPMSEREKDLFYDLLKKMLKRKPSHRIGIEEVIQHSWFTTDYDAIEKEEEEEEDSARCMRYESEEKAEE